MIWATSHMRSALATEDPPNFITTLICKHRGGRVDRRCSSQYEIVDQGNHSNCVPAVVPDQAVAAEMSLQRH